MKLDKGCKRLVAEARSRIGTVTVDEAKDLAAANHQGLRLP